MLPVEKNISFEPNCNAGSNLCWKAADGVWRDVTVRMSQILSIGLKNSISVMCGHQTDLLINLSLCAGPVDLGCHGDGNLVGRVQNVKLFWRFRNLLEWGKKGWKTSNISEIMNNINEKDKRDRLPIEMNILRLNGVNSLKNVEGVKGELRSI